MAIRAVLIVSILATAAIAQDQPPTADPAAAKVVIDPTPLRPRTPLAWPGPIQIKGPGQIPTQLQGVWKVSLCSQPGHSWIRYEHVETGEVHTIARFRKGAGGRKSKATGQVIVPAVPESGLYWDQDIRMEPDVRAGRFILLSCLVKDPAIPVGKNQGAGYAAIDDNCATYARDAWHYYTGEFYELGAVHYPNTLGEAAWKKYPALNYPERIKLGD
jgi:hypothetical protein